MDKQPKPKPAIAYIRVARKEQLTLEQQRDEVYVIEKRFESEEELLEDMEHFSGDVELKGFLDDVFGGG